MRTPIRHSRLARRAPLAIPLVVGLALLLPVLAPVAAAGPPFPEPVNDQAVYDEAGVLREATIQQLEQTIDGIESRTGAEVVVYTQLVPSGVTTEEAEAHAIALMDQWGVGRAGIDDGLVILFDLHEGDPCHGQVQLYGGPGYRATYLSNEERQQIFDEDMLPLLRRCDLDGAAIVAMAKVDENATPEHAATITFFRQANALLGLIIAPLLFVLVLAWAILTWFRSGRDPIYLDDPSIHIPAPPPGLTPAAGATVRDGQVSRRALTAASLDLAVRGLISFEAEDKEGLFASGQEIGIHTTDTVIADPKEQARVVWARRRPMDEGTNFLYRHLKSIGGSADYVKPEEIVEFGKDVPGFERRVEDHCVTQGWFKERPAQVKGRWRGRGGLLFIVGILAIILGANLPSSGIALVGARARRDGHRAVRHRRRDAGGHPRGLDDPGHARGLQAHPREDDGAGALDGAGRRRVRDPAHRIARRRRRVGRRARPPGRGPAGARADGRGRAGGPGVVGLRPALVRVAGERLLVGRQQRRRGYRARADEHLRHPELRRHDGRAGHDRELARVLRVGRVRWRRVQRRRRPAAVAAGPAAGSSGLVRGGPGPAGRVSPRSRTCTVHSGPWEPRTRWRSSSSVSTRATSRAPSR